MEKVRARVRVHEFTRLWEKGVRNKYPHTHTHTHTSTHANNTITNQQGQPRWQMQTAPASCTVVGKQR